MRIGHKNYVHVHPSGMKFRGQTIIKYTQFVRNQQRFDVSIPAFFCFCIQNWERESRMQIHVLKPACFSRICYVHGIRQYISVERSIFQYVATRGTSNTLESNRTHEPLFKSREKKNTENWMTKCERHQQKRCWRLVCTMYKERRESERARYRYLHIATTRDTRAQSPLYLPHGAKHIAYRRCRAVLYQAHI